MIYPDHMGIPAIREELYRLAANEGRFIGGQLVALAEASFRKPAVRKARRKLPKLTQMMAQEIREYARATPDASQLEIANHFKVNPGRVSEALNYKR